tara:strand:- start:17859 stop:18800 length:942 start_codon:yes stop_codon:yes gene_type:complete
MNSNKNIPTIILGLVVSLFLFGNNLNAKTILWESGSNLFIKLAKQDKSASGKTPPNSHPVTLNEKDVGDALLLLELWDKDYYEEGMAERVFTVEMARLLGEHISAGLKIADTKEDITFAVVGRKGGMLGSYDTVYTAGRAFYLDGSLNLILGDWDRSPDKGKEVAYAGTATEKPKYVFTLGKRRKPSKMLDKSILTVEGIENIKVKGKTRKDWFKFDLEKTKLAVIASKEKKRRSSKEYKQEKLLKDEAAKLAKERREIRLEMARMRKEMEASMKPDSLSTEERLQKLQVLKEKNLISDEEYDKKRADILNDI